MNCEHAETLIDQLADGELADGELADDEADLSATNSGLLNGLKGQNIIAQGNALGARDKNVLSPVGAAQDVSALSGRRRMGILPVNSSKRRPSYDRSPDGRRCATVTSLFTHAGLRENQS